MGTVVSEAKKLKTSSPSGQGSKESSPRPAPPAGVSPSSGRNIRTERRCRTACSSNTPRPWSPTATRTTASATARTATRTCPGATVVTLPSSQSDPLNNSSSAIDINTILASANNASSILSAAMNTTSTTLSQDDLADKIQKRIQKATCINCSAMFLDPRDLKKHILTHKKTLYACELCSEKFPTVFLLKKHSRVHQPSLGSVAHSNQNAKHGNEKKSKRKRDDDPDWE